VLRNGQADARHGPDPSGATAVGSYGAGDDRRGCGRRGGSGPACTAACQLATRRRTHPAARLVPERVLLRPRPVGDVRRQRLAPAPPSTGSAVGIQPGRSTGCAGAGWHSRHGRICDLRLRHGGPSGRDLRGHRTTVLPRGDAARRTGGRAVHEPGRRTARLP
jgi:hypothetical protein